MKLAVFASGGLGLSCLKQLHSQYAVAVIFTDRQSIDIIDFAKSNSILLFAGNPRNGKGSAFLKSHGISFDLLVSVNYLFLIEQDLIQYPTVAAINFHGSLLPRYRGRTPHVWAIINNEKLTGITAHFIAEGCDEGPVIDQLEIPISREETGGGLLAKFNSLYPGFINQVVSRFASGKVIGRIQDESQATFFGKRTPESGRIDWSWSREKIYNWVRAQADPYPGAFAFCKEQKIIIDKIEFSDAPHNFADPHGLVLEGGSNPVVKTGEGAVRLVAIRGMYNFERGEIFQ